VQVIGGEPARLVEEEDDKERLHLLDDVRSVAPRGLRCEQLAHTGGHCVILWATDLCLGDSSQQPALEPLEEVKVRGQPQRHLRTRLIVARRCDPTDTASRAAPR
jgi:hypothetical protein